MDKSIVEEEADGRHVGLVLSQTMAAQQGLPDDEPKVGRERQKSGWSEREELKPRKPSYVSRTHSLVRPCAACPRPVTPARG